jgi:hypothetical protein
MGTGSVGTVGTQLGGPLRLPLSELAVAGPTQDQGLWQSEENGIPFSLGPGRVQSPRLQGL